MNVVRKDSDLYRHAYRVPAPQRQDDRGVGAVEAIGEVRSPSSMNLEHDGKPRPSDAIVWTLASASVGNSSSSTMPTFCAWVEYPDEPSPRAVT